MSYSGFLAVGIGGVLGCWLRWLLAIALNPLFPNLPLGTLAANLVGGLLMGVVLGIFDHFQTLPPELRLVLPSELLIVPLSATLVLEPTATVPCAAPMNCILIGLSALT